MIVGWVAHAGARARDRTRPPGASLAAATGTIMARVRTLLADLGARFEGPALRRETVPDVVALSAVLLVGAAILIFRLGAAEICSSNEAVEALVVQQMVEHGELLAPVLNGHAPMFKPPLFHWTATAIASGLGIPAATELTVRLPSVAFGLVCVLFTMVFVRSWLGLPNAILSGIVLLATFQFVVEARFGRVDMALTCCESLALFAMIAWLTRADRDDSSQQHAPAFADARLYVAAVALGLSVLAKGPVGMILPVAAIVATLATERRWRDLRTLASPGPLVALVAVSSSWYLACLWAGRVDVLHLQILDENFSRFTGGIRTMSPFYYVTPLLLNSAPLSLVVPIAVGMAWRTRRAQTGDASGDLRPYALAVFWIVTVLFFSIAAYKRRAYLLPLWPPAAALLVWWLDSWRDESRRRVAKGALVATCGALIAFDLWFVPYVERSGCGGAQYRAAASAINGTVPREEPLYFDAETTEWASLPLLFYLDRTVPVLPDGSADLTKGYVLVPERTWAGLRGPTEMQPLLRVELERFHLVLVDRAALRPG